MVAWWQTGSVLGHIQEALAHINRTRTSAIYTNTEFCRCLFDALNKTWTAFSDFQKEPGRGDTKSFAALLIDGMPEKYIEEFLESRELQNLVEFKPHIMNHDTLRNNREYRPDVEINPRLMKDATKEHHQLANAYKSYKESPSGATKERVVKKTAQLLYIVRSNIAHGEKTPYGPDLKKAERDEEVSGVVKPVLLKLLDLIFDKPDQKLVIYGTLAIGAPNESILKGIEGTWQECKIRGEIVDREGLKYFKWNPNADEIHAKMFTSKYLHNKLPNIDAFEGNRYQRILILAEVEDYWIIANIYEGKRC